MHNGITLIIIIIINTIIGVLIKLSNPLRSQNKQFFNFSIALTIWMLCVLAIMNSSSAESASLLIRLATIAATTLPFQLGMLVQSIRNPTLSYIKLLKGGLPVAIIGIIIALISLTDFFMSEVIMPSVQHPNITVPDAQYGPGFLIFSLYFFITLISVMVSATKSMLSSAGLVRLEIQYVLLGSGVMLVSGFFISLVLPLLAQTTQVQQYGPVSVLAMNLVIAYGIATKRILEVGTVMRKIVAYTLLTSYLTVVYFSVWSCTNFLIFRSAPNANLIAQLMASITVAFSMAPMHGRLQRVTNKLITSHSMDIPSTMKKAGDIFQSVTTIDALMGHFAKLLSASVRAETVRIMFKKHDALNQQYPALKTGNIISLENVSAFTSMIAQTKEPVNIDTLVRGKQTSLNKQAQSELKALGASMAIGIFSKSELQGMVLFGPRFGGRIYDKTEQDALQILCNQFAVALENAELYTEVQDSKIRNEIMLDQLVSGVIVASPSRKITLFNHEAQRITGIEEYGAIGQSIDILPRPILKTLDSALKSKKGKRNIDAVLFSVEDGNDSASIRMGSTFLFGHDGKPMGALLVFTDMTELKSLEEQVRRTDQLSSVGTLAAGMAHEIKNPLVTIKTFTQLLPQRYADEDFRNDFSSLVAHEVSRIDGIVNELLSFSKPAKPHLVTMKLQETIEQTLKLTHEQMVQRNISLKNKCTAQVDLISGDAKLLSQALVNLYLNAIDAIGNNGTITVGTLNCIYRFANPEAPEKPTSRNCIRVIISDTGKGIEKGNLQKIFDPFFTSKSEGTGMGLSVSHGIISEHHGVIEVESELGRGTTFSVYLPVIDEEVSA